MPVTDLVGLSLVAIRVDSPLASELSSLVVTYFGVRVALYHFLLVVLINVDILVLRIAALGLA